MPPINLPDQVRGVLSPSFGGVAEVTQNNEVLPASTKARALQSLEINSAYNYQIPATSSLIIEAFTYNKTRAMWVNVLDFGADPTGTSDSTTAFTNAIAALPATGGWVYAPTGTYKTSSTITFLPNQCLRGDGENVTIIKYTGTGPCLTSSNPGGPVGNQNYNWVFKDLTVDGTNAGVGAMGIRLTNLLNCTLENVDVRFFQTTGGIGIGYDASVDSPGPEEVYATWERWYFHNVTLFENSTALDFNGGNGGYGSFDLYIIANANQCGITSRNGALNYACQWKMRGYFNATLSTNNGWVFGIDPGDPTGTSFWQGNTFDITVLLYQPGVTQRPSHQTIVMGSASNILNGFGTMDFFAPAFLGAEQQPLSILSGASIYPGALLSVGGYISDPAVLGGIIPGHDAASFQGGTQWKVYGSNTSTLSTGDIQVANADVHEYLLNSGTTTITSFRWAPFKRSRKVEFLLRQPASGAAGTITWPSNVVWAAGNGVLSTANGAVDKVRFTYIPSTDTWYGEMNRNYTATAMRGSLPLQTSRASSATTLALTIASTQVQYITGTTQAQIITLPTTLVQSDYDWVIVNTMTTANVTVEASDGTTVGVVAPNEIGTFTAVVNTPTTNTQWTADTRIGGVALKAKTGTIVITTNGTSVVYTLPAASDTLAGLAATQTLTNKTLTSPTLTSPTLGTPASGTLTNCTGLPVAGGGTGATTLTGLVKGNGTSAMTAVTAPTGTVVGTSDTQTLTNKTLTLPTINGYVEGRQALGTVTTAATVAALSNGTICTATLTDATTCAFTLPTPVAGASFVLFVFQSATAGSGLYSFTTPSGSLFWPAAGAPVMTQGANMVDQLTFISPLGTNWYGSYSQGY